MSRTCPACGGATLRQITSTFFECETPMDASIPPAVAGNPGWLHASRPCGHRFQLGTPAGSLTPCGVPRCGRDSIGTCQGGCARRLCGLHGTTGGSFVCRDCLAEQERQRERERTERTTAAGVAARAAAEEASTELAACEEPRAVHDIIVSRPTDVRLDACKAAWCRLVEAGLQPTHEVIKIEGLANPAARWFGRTSRGAWTESKEPRLAAWYAPSTRSRQVPTNEPRAAGLEEKDLYLDASGSLWLAMGPFTEATIALPLGQRVVVRRGSAGAGLVKWLIDFGAHSLSEVESTDAQYARAMAIILRESQ